MAKHRKLTAPTWTNNEIIAAAARLGEEYINIVGTGHVLEHGLQFDDFYDKLLFPKFKIDLYEDQELGEDGSGKKILGRYDVRGNVAYLDRLISRESNDPRRIFTCWHEVAGHGALQGDWLRKQLGQTGEFETVDVTEASLSERTERRLERQANLFASRLAAPDWLVHFAMIKTFKPNRRFLFKEPCIYWLDVQGLRLKKYIVDAGDLSGWIGSKISGYFGGLSAEAIGYRVRELGWILDRSLPDLYLHRTEHSVPSRIADLLTV